MPRHPKRRARKPRRHAARRARKTRVPRSLSSIPQTARVVETVQTQDLLANTMYQNFFSLNDFNRARMQSLGFSRMKATKVTWTYEPLYNTFQDGIGALSAPYFFTRMNRGQDDRVPTTLGELQACGAMAKKFDKVIHISYKPNWLSPGLLGQNVLNVPTVSAGNQQMVQAITCYGVKTEYGYMETSPYNQTQDPQGAVIVPVGLPRRTPGTIVPVFPGLLDSLNVLSTNLQSGLAVYNGHNVYFDQKVYGANQPIARVTCTVEWQFKDPKWWDAIVQTNTLANPPPSAVSTS